MINIVLAFLFFTSIKAYSFTGLERLNSFLNNSEYHSLSFSSVEENIDINSSVKTTDNINNYKRIYLFEYGKKINSLSYWSISLPYIYNLGEELGPDGSVQDRFNHGLREPKLSFYFRPVMFERDKTIWSFRASLIPSLFDKKANSKNANGAVGNSIIELDSKVGALYDTWEAAVNLRLRYNFEYEETDLKTNKKTCFTPYSEISATISIQKELPNQYFINLDSGVILIQDKDYVISKSKDSTIIQRGTSSIVGIGLMKVQGPHIYSIKYIKHVSDYFAQSNIYNIEGDSYQRVFKIEYTKEI